MDRALAESGLLVVAIDMTNAPEAPYPASVQDANYGVRWLKWKAPSWNGDASKSGIGRKSRAAAMWRSCSRCSDDKRYNSIPLPEAPGIDATVAYVACRSPISDPFARFKNAEKMRRDDMVQNHYTYFKPWGDDSREQSAGNPGA